MANHIVRPDWRGNLVVISRSTISPGKSYRSDFPYAEPAQAFARCMAECQVDVMIDAIQKIMRVK